MSIPQKGTLGTLKFPGLSLSLSSVQMRQFRNRGRERERARTVQTREGEAMDRGVR